MIGRAAVDISLNDGSPLREDYNCSECRFKTYSWGIPSIWFHVRSLLNISCFSEIQTVKAYNVSSHSETWLRTREELTHASGLNKLHVIKINDCKRFLWVYCDWTFSSIQQYINNSRHLARKYLVNKPLQAAGMSADNVRG